MFYDIKVICNFLYNNPKNASGIETINPHGHAATRMINPLYIHSAFASTNIIGGRMTVKSAIKITIGV